MSLKTTEQRFFEKIEKFNGCWNWISFINRGYGYFWNGKKSVRAHRYAYETFVERIPTGLVLDHLCRNTRCVNPGHLEAVSIKENILRGTGFAAVNKKKVNCKFGHAIDYVRPSGGRECSTCSRDKLREWRALRKAKMAC